MATKTFPKWAPAVLVHLYAVRQEKPFPDVRALCESALIRAGFSAEQAKVKAAERASKELFLPETEKNELLEKLLTDGRMESVWRNIGKRITNNQIYHQLLFDIEMSITGWRRDLKMSRVERAAYFSRIHDLAMELFEILKDVPIGTFKSSMETRRLITDEDVRYYLEDVLDLDIRNFVRDPHIKTADEFVDYAKFWLSEVVPHLDTVLLNIALVASQNIGEPQFVKKPRARKAATHYFVKNLSATMRHRFNQPLHDTVAAIACVVLNDESIDSDLVRKLTRDAPGRFEEQMPKIPPGDFPYKISKKPSSKKSH